MIMIYPCVKVVVRVHVDPPPVIGILQAIKVTLVRPVVNIIDYAIGNGTCWKRWGYAPWWAVTPGDCFDQSGRVSIFRPPQRPQRIRLATSGTG